MDLVRFRVTGVSPLLMNNPLSMRGGQATVGAKKIPSPEEEAASKVYRLPDGQLYLGATALRSSVIDGGKGLRLGKLGASGILSSAVFVTREECPLVDPATGEPVRAYAIDTRRVVVQNQGIIRARPSVWPWQCEVEFEFEAEQLTTDHILRFFATAGKVVGVGDYRPRCPRGKGGPFGRYTVDLVE